MNRQTTALIFILSLLAVFVTITMAEDATDATGAAETPTPAAAAQPMTTEAPQPSPPNEVVEEGSGSVDATTTAGSFTYSAIGAVATALIANFF